MGAFADAVDGLFVRPAASEPAREILRSLAPRPTNALADSTAVVIGGSGGIGRAIVEVLSEGGAAVVSADLRLPTSPDLAGVTTTTVDITDEASVRELRDMAVKCLGRVDLLVNTAGVIEVKPFLETSSAEWARVINVNLVAAFSSSRLFAQTMVDQDLRLGRRGQIVNVGSLAAFFGRPLVSSYGASKAGLNNLSQSIASALGPKDISATVVFPGNVREGMWGHLGKDFADIEGRQLEDVESERRYQPSREIGEIVADIHALPGLALSGCGVTFLRGVEEL